MTRPPRILVVDDQPVNLTVMRKKLERDGMQVILATRGAECLDLAGSEQPDLILLDVMMPEMDGVEVCRRLKAADATRSIPVIFLTARDSRAGKLEGLTVGAVDYIAKPIDLDETLARVRAQLRYHTTFKENLELTERLGEARRAAAMGALSHGISHNLNNLLGVIYGYVELSKLNVGKPEALRKNLEKIDEAVTRMTRIIRQVTAVSTQSRLQLSPTPVAKLLAGAVARFRHDHPAPIAIEVRDATDDATLLTNIEVFEDGVSKLLINAAESHGSPPPEGAAILLEAVASSERDRPGVRFSVHDRGNGVDPGIRDHVFEPFVSTKSTVGVGMGLTIARHGIRNLGGEISLADRPGGGTTAAFHLPSAPAASAAAA